MSKSALLSTTAPLHEPPDEHVPDTPDQLVPDPVVWREFGITAMTGWRWSHDTKLDFPPPISIRGRCYRSRRLLEEFKARVLKLALEARAAPSDTLRKKSA